MESNAQVLVVDDMIFNINAVELQLKVYGITTDVAISGYQAIDLVKTRLSNMADDNSCK